jgi:hypothetical protein
MTRKRKRPPPDPDFPTFRDTILLMVRDTGKTFQKPDEDWIPVAFLMTPKGMVVVALMDLFRDNAAKDQIAPALTSLFREQKPSMAAMVTSAWMRRLDHADPLLDLHMQMSSAFGIRDHPERTEVLMVEVADAAGKDEIWSAGIVRSEDKPPVLAEWQQWPGEATGRVAGVLQRAFEAVRE